MEGWERIAIPSLSYSAGFCFLIVLLTISFPFKAESGKTGALESDRLFLKSQLQDGSLRVLYSGIDKVELLLLTPKFSIEPADEIAQRYLPLGKEFQRLSIKGYGCLSEEGKPQLPMKGVLLATPVEHPDFVGEEAEVTVKVSESSVLSFSGLSLAVNGFKNGLNGLGHLRRKSNQLNPSRSLATSATSADSYPGKLAEIGFSGYLRDARVVQLCIYPVQYNPFRKEVKLYTKLRITVEFFYKSKRPFRTPSRGGAMSAAPKAETSAISKQPKEWEKIYNHTIANYQSLQSFHPSNRPSFHGFDTQATQPKPSIPFTSPIAPRLQRQTRYKLIVDEDGIYRLTYRDFLDAGIDVSSINPKTLKLTNKGKAVPLFVSGENDGFFDDCDYLEFHGEFNRGKYSLYGEYTTENVYWLSWGQENGARMVPSEGGSGKSEGGRILVPLSYLMVAHFEEDRFRGSLGYVDAKRDFWFWGKGVGKQILEYPFELHDVIQTVPPFRKRGVRGDFKVRVRLHGQSVQQHHTKILLNGGELSDALWNGQREYLYESLPLKGSLLLDGENILALESVGDTPAGKSDVVYFNWFEIEYWRAFIAVDDILPFEIREPGAYQFKLTGFSKKTIEVYKGKACKLQNYKIFREGDTYSLTFFDEIVTPTKYLAICTQRKKKPKPQLLRSKKNALFSTLLAKDEPSFLRSPSNGADYIIIVYDDFYEDVLPLAKHRSNQFRTMVVKVSDVYDEFSYGLFSPEAIRDFLRYVYRYWQKPSPTYVLLVGDATWDFKYGKNYVPAYYFNSFKWGLAGTDNLYACVNGDDPLPDLFIGRIPTRTKEETRAVVEKIIRYETRPHFGTWRRNLLMLAAPLSFEQDSERLLDDYVKPDDGYEVLRVYVDANSKYHGGTEELIDFWNKGVGFVHFTGHGGGAMWSDNKLFTLNDVQMLQNRDMLPFVVSFTCFTGYFDSPDRSCLNELFVKKKEGGAIAAFGSTGLGWVKGDYYMGKALFESLFTLGTRRLSEAMVETKIILMINHKGYADMVNLYNLLGDAAVHLPLPPEKIDMTARLIKDEMKGMEGWKDGRMEGLQLEVRGIIACGPGHRSKAGESSDFLEGSALLEVESQDDALEFQNTKLKIEGGRFDVTISPVKSPFVLPKEKELLIRCYAWSESLDAPWDAAGAHLIKIAGKDDVDLSVFSDDITFTTLEDASSRSKPSNRGDKNTRKVKLQVTVYNLGQKQVYSVLVAFYAGNPFSGGEKIGEVVIEKIDGLGKALAEIEWQTDAEKKTIHCQIDPKNEIHELNEANNTAEKTLIFSIFTITPEDGSAGEIKSSDGNLQVRIDSGAVMSAVMLSIESVAPPPLFMQPQLKYSPLPSRPSGCVYRLSIIKGDDGKNDVFAEKAVISLTFRYEKNASPLRDEKRPENERTEDLGIFRYRDDFDSPTVFEQWEIDLKKGEQNLDISSNTVSATVPLTQEFAKGLLFTLMVFLDRTPPLIQLSLHDERLPYDGFYTSSTPTLSATVSDANGVGEILFFLNEKQVDFSDLVYSHTDNTTAVSFSPTLKAGNYHLRVCAFDLCGNYSFETLSFSVGGEMKLLKVSNHPNPFENETYFTYVLLNEAEEVKIKIYTTSGRLIAQLDAPTKQGYNEILWDCKDKDGDDVANGAYFYKIIVKTEKERLSHVGKLLVQ